MLDFREPDFVCLSVAIHRYKDSMPLATEHEFQAAIKDLSQILRRHLKLDIWDPLSTPYLEFT